MEKIQDFAFWCFVYEYVQKSFCLWSWKASLFDINQQIAQLISTGIGPPLVANNISRI
jgi:hypothetical protein